MKKIATKNNENNIEEFFNEYKKLLKKYSINCCPCMFPVNFYEKEKKSSIKDMMDESTLFKSEKLTFKTSGEFNRFIDSFIYHGKQFECNNCWESGTQYLSFNKNDDYIFVKVEYNKKRVAANFFITDKKLNKVVKTIIKNSTYYKRYFVKDDIFFTMDDFRKYVEKVNKNYGTTYVGYGNDEHTFSIFKFKGDRNSDNKTVSNKTIAIYHNDDDNMFSIRFPSKATISRGGKELDSFVLSDRTYKDMYNEIVKMFDEFLDGRENI